MRPAAQLHAQTPLFTVLRHGEAEIVGPAAVVQVVVVEVDGGIQVRRALPVALAVAPRGTLHGACRQVHEPAVQSVGSGVLDLHRGHAAGEVPGAQPAIAGASILPLKQRRAGRSAALSAPMNTGCAASIERPSAVVLASPSSSTGESTLQGLLPHPHHAGRRDRPRPRRDTRSDCAASCPRRRAHRRIPAPCRRVSAPARSLRPGLFLARQRAARSRSAVRPRAGSARSTLRPQGRRAASRRQRARSARRSPARRAAGARRSGRRTARTRPRAPAPVRRDWDRRARCAPAWRCTVPVPRSRP